MDVQAPGRSGDRRCQLRVELPVEPASVDAYLVAGRVGAAAAAAKGLELTAQAYPSPAARATAAQARGAVSLARDHPADALGDLRLAAEEWRRLGMPYEVALTGVRIAEACWRLGDDDGARAMVPVEALRAQVLSSRETEVILLIVEGRTNAEIATRLHLSERTVHRHVSNILTKLQVTSRTAAAIHAVQHGLARARDS